MSDDFDHGIQAAMADIPRRRRVMPEELIVLQEFFDNVTMRPSNQQREQLAGQLTMTPRTVQVWFQNRRAKAKKENSMSLTDVNPSNSYNTTELATSPPEYQHHAIQPFQTTSPAHTSNYSSMYSHGPSTTQRVPVSSSIHLLPTPPLQLNGGRTSPTPMPRAIIPAPTPTSLQQQRQHILQQFRQQSNHALSSSPMVHSLNMIPSLGSEPYNYMSSHVFSSHNDQQQAMIRTQPNPYLSSNYSQSAVPFTSAPESTRYTSNSLISSVTSLEQQQLPPPLSRTLTNFMPSPPLEYQPTSKLISLDLLPQDQNNPNLLNSNDNFHSQLFESNLSLTNHPFVSSSTSIQTTTTIPQSKVFDSQILSLTDTPKTFPNSTSLLSRSEPLLSTHLSKLPSELDLSELINTNGLCDTDQDIILLPRTLIMPQDSSTLTFSLTNQHKNENDDGESMIVDTTHLLDGGETRLRDCVMQGNDVMFTTLPTTYTPHSNGTTNVNDFLSDVFLSGSAYTISHSSSSSFSCLFDVDNDKANSILVFSPDHMTDPLQQQQQVSYSFTKLDPDMVPLHKSSSLIQLQPASPNKKNHNKRKNRYCDARPKKRIDKITP